MKIFQPLSLSYLGFYKKHLIPNIPCLFDSTLTIHWLAFSAWNNENGIDIETIITPFIGEKVCVADCCKLEFGSHSIESITMTEYLSYWKNRKEHRDTRLLYLKDWHYFQKHKEPPLFTLPIYFSSDWLNEFSEFRTDLNDDFKFVYLGQAGTWTPLHVDVYGSYSWSVNISGRKRWWIFPPGEEMWLPKHGSQLPSDIQNEVFANPDEDNSQHPLCYIFDQLPGQAFFVPSGWYHQVVNLTDCVSINHNWINACNIHFVWRHLQKQLDDVKKSTADVAETPGWAQACQVCLKALEGWSYVEFFLMLKYILFSRFTRLGPQEVQKRLCSPLPCEVTESRFEVLLYQLDSLIFDLFTGSGDFNDLLSAHFMASSVAAPTLDFEVSSEDGKSSDLMPDWLRLHDLKCVVQAIANLLGDPDVQALGIPRTGRLAPFWEQLQITSPGHP